MYLKSNLCIEGYHGLLVVDGWELKDQHWNGWCIPLFEKAAADVIAEEIGLAYNEETDTYKETEKSAGDSDYFEEWEGGFNEQLGVHVYAIGAMYWCWSSVEEDELKDITMNVIDRRSK